MSRRETPSQCGRVGSPVIDADDLQRNPEGILRRFFHLLGLPFNERLLHWDSGSKVTKSWIISKINFEMNIQNVGYFKEALKSCQFHPLLQFQQERS